MRAGAPPLNGNKEGTMINKIKDNVILNDRSRKVTLVNMNWFFVVTLAVVIFNIVRHTLPEGADPTNESPEWKSFSLDNLFIALSRSYMHSNWQHCMLNMLCFFVAGIYLERKKGSLGMLLLVFTMSLFTAFATAANYLSLSPLGFSGVNYGLYGYIIIDYIFVLACTPRRYAFNVISGAVVLCLIYLAMCFNGGTSTVSFVPYPYDLLHNIAHSSGFVTGIALGVFESALFLLIRYRTANGDGTE